MGTQESLLVACHEPRCDFPRKIKEIPRTPRTLPPQNALQPLREMFFARRVRTRWKLKTPVTGRSGAVGMGFAKPNVAVQPTADTLMKMTPSPVRLAGNWRAAPGKIGWILLWLVGIPIPVLIVLFLLRGCT